MVGNNSHVNRRLEKIWARMAKLVKWLWISDWGSFHSGVRHFSLHHHVPTFWCPPGSYPIGFFPRNVKVITHLHLLLRLKMHEAVTPCIFKVWCLSTGITLSSILGNMEPGYFKNVTDNLHVLIESCWKSHSPGHVAYAYDCLTHCYKTMRGFDVSFKSDFQISNHFCSMWLEGGREYVV
jgi:hypothetical protein